MNLKRQLLLVSLLTLILPWAGCQFVRETESALRQVQADMLAGNARTLANLLAQYPEELPPAAVRGNSDDRLYLHPLDKSPQIDGYFDDWPIPAAALQSMRGPQGQIRYAAGEIDGDVYLYVAVRDRSLVYARDEAMAHGTGTQHADRVALISRTPPLAYQEIVFAAEAPGLSVSYVADGDNFDAEPAITAFWQDTPQGYQLEARLPLVLLGSNLGLVVYGTADAATPATRAQNFSGPTAGPLARQLPGIEQLLRPFVASDMRAIVTDADGWRIAVTGELPRHRNTDRAVWSRRFYDLLVEPGRDAGLAEPAALGRERRTYIAAALDGSQQSSWFRSNDDGRAIVAAATPIVSDGDVVGALVLQQRTDAILSLTNSGLSRLINLTVIATLVVALALLGYATWLSRRIRRLSKAAEAALDQDQPGRALPSATAGDEIGDLSRSFSFVLQQLGEYNAYLRTLASKLSHELRTPLAIVTSSLENLEQEALPQQAQGYVERASDGTDRLRRILNAMSEANRVEELMENSLPERFDLQRVLEATIDAYRDAYSGRRFSFLCNASDSTLYGSPELIVQMLDKLVDNAVGFSNDGDEVGIELLEHKKLLLLCVTNPGPPLPERMRSQLFDSMISVRGEGDARHLGLGLYIARLIAEGHGGRIGADNTDGGVRFEISLPKP